VVVDDGERTSVLASKERKMLRFRGCVWLFVALFAGAVLVATVAAVQGPSSAAMAGTTARTAAATASCPSSEQQQHKPLFGMPQRIPNAAAAASSATSALLQDLRGGHVHEPETAADVDALVLKAASEQKLVVIDFSATWCGTLSSSSRAVCFRAIVCKTERRTAKLGIDDRAIACMC